jgi:site-specific DNA-methyltransferase (adenine-specific)
MISIAKNLDCMDIQAMKSLPNKFIDIAVCDIPYGIDVGNMAYLHEAGTRVKQKNGSRLNPRKNAIPYQKKDWDKIPPTQEYFDELRRVSINQIIFGIEYVSWKGVERGRIQWDKGVADGMSFKRYEVAYCSFIETTYRLPLLWSGMLQAKSLSEPMTQQGNKKLNEKRIHPTHKPVLLYKHILQCFAKPGDKILDTHMGGGSSRIAAYDMGFDYYGYEIDPEYFKAGEARFQKHIAQQRIEF